MTMAHEALQCPRQHTAHEQHCNPARLSQHVFRSMLHRRTRRLALHIALAAADGGGGSRWSGRSSDVGVGGGSGADGMHGDEEKGAAGKGERTAYLRLVDAAGQDVGEEEVGCCGTWARQVGGEREGSGETY